jgi:hypothetical protein
MGGMASSAWPCACADMVPLADSWNHAIRRWDDATRSERRRKHKKKPRGSLPRGLAVDLIAYGSQLGADPSGEAALGLRGTRAPSSWRYPRSPPIQSEIVTGSPPSRKKIPGQPLVTRCFRPFPPRTVARGTSPGPHPLRVGRRGPCRAFPMLERVGNDRCPDAGSIGAVAETSMVFPQILDAGSTRFSVGIKAGDAGAPVGSVRGSTGGVPAAILPPR